MLGTGWTAALALSCLCGACVVQTHHVQLLLGLSACCLSMHHCDGVLSGVRKSSCLIGDQVIKMGAECARPGDGCLQRLAGLSLSRAGRHRGPSGSCAPASGSSSHSAKRSMPRHVAVRAQPVTSTSAAHNTDRMTVSGLRSEVMVFVMQPPHHPL